MTYRGYFPYLKATHEFDEMDPEFKRFAEDFGFDMILGHMEDHLRMLNKGDETFFRCYVEPDGKIGIEDFQTSEDEPDEIVPVAELYAALARRV